MADSKLLFEKIKKGDKKSFEVLFRDLYPALCAFARKLLNDMDSAEEVVQDVFFTIWKKRQEINVEHDLVSYIYTSVRNRCLAYLKRIKIRAEYAKYVLSEYEMEQFTVEDELRLQELEALVEKTLKALPLRTRKIFELSRFDGLKYQEIAVQLSISVKTVEVNISKALKVFRKNLKEYIPIKTEN